MTPEQKAHGLTDNALEALERRISRVYAQAGKDMEEKLNAYTRQFERLDAQKKALVEAGKLTQKEYEQWRLNKVAVGELWEAKRNNLAQDYLNADKIAYNILNGELPNVYALNHNYTAYALENQTNMNLQFTLYDKASVERLLKENKKLLPLKDITGKSFTTKVIRWNEQKVQSAVMQGLLQGESIPNIAKRLEQVTEMNKKSAIRNARTAVTGAENAGRQDTYNEAVSKGIKLKKEWMATLDNRTRHSHATLDGKRVDEDEKFPNGLEYPGDPSGDPAEVYNCRCTMIAVVDGVEEIAKSVGEYQPRMTYSEWEKAKQDETYSTFADGEQASEFFGQRPPRSLRRENRDEYDRLMEQYRKSSFGSWYDGLSGEETTSISEYSGDGYSGINGLLRGKMTEKMVKAWDDVSSMGIRKMIDHLDDSISRFELKNGIKVYRTCEKDVFDNLSKQVGSKFVDDGFVSTTVLNKKVASGNVFMEIDVPPGIGRGAWINPLSGSADEEWEFLLQRGSVFEITGVSDVGDDIVVKMKWTGIEKKDIEVASREDVIAWQKKNGLYDETEEYRI